MASLTSSTRRRFCQIQHRSPPPPKRLVSPLLLLACAHLPSRSSSSHPYFLHERKTPPTPTLPHTPPPLPPHPATATTSSIFRRRRFRFVSLFRVVVCFPPASFRRDSKNLLCRSLNSVKHILDAQRASPRNGIRESETARVFTTYHQPWGRE